jgi:uncharacterized membrane protein
MNKFEFLTVLKRNLSKLPKEEIDSAISFYEEYFNDAGEENEQEVIEKLGSSQAVAAKIIGEFALKDIETQKKKSKVTIWFIILAIFASPIVLPLSIIVVAIFISLLIILLSIYLTAFAASVGIVALGLSAFISSFEIFVISIPTGIFFVGSGLFALAAGAAAIVAIIKLSKTTILGIKKALSNFLLRRNKK